MFLFFFFTANMYLANVFIRQSGFVYSAAEEKSK